MPEMLFLGELFLFKKTNWTLLLPVWTASAEREQVVTEALREKKKKGRATSPQFLTLHFPAAPESHVDSFNLPGHRGSAQPAAWRVTSLWTESARSIVCD